VLVVLAGLIRARIRATDSLARWGGEEFVVLSPGVTLEGAAALAERLRSAAGTYEHESAGTVTASFGVAQYRAGETPDELFARADEALYRAKDGGRDRVEVAR
jgi:two-component system cell cycle response regulator